MIKFFKSIFSSNRTKKLTKINNPNNKGHQNTKKQSNKKALRIGELGEYKINIQLDQLPDDCLYIDDLMIHNPKSKTGYSQVDHLVISPYGLFVIETKNYSGKIRGKKEDKHWWVNRRFKMYNPIRQNYGHIMAIERALHQYQNVRFISIISFTMRCRFSLDPELRKIDSDQLVIYDTELSEYIDRKILRIKQTSSMPTYTVEQVKEIYNILSGLHIEDTSIRVLHNRSANESSQQISLKYQNSCFICGEKVSAKVNAFCLANQSRFKGNVYCFEHQRSV